MLLREICPHDLCSDAGRGNVHFDALPTIFPIGIGEKTTEHFRVQLTFTFEIAVEPAVGQPCSGHDLADGNIVETVAIK